MAFTATKKEYQIDDNQIQMTEDYALFKTLVGNRIVDASHVGKLMKAMRLSDLFTPIMVNEKYEVIDGQHRLEARKRLGYIVPYYVVKNYGLAEIQAINSQQKKWSVADYTQSYIALGRKDYEIYQWFRSRYKLAHTTSLYLLLDSDSAGGAAISEIFNSGNLRIKDLESAKSKAETLEKIAPYFTDYSHRSFVNAFFNVCDKKIFNLKQFLGKLETQPNALRKCATMEQYVELIEEIYNYRSQSKVSLKYND